MVITEAKQEYDAWHARRAVDEEADAPWHLLVRRHLRPEIDLAGRRVLEIGCGRGGFSCWLAGRPQPPRELIAADFSDTAVSKGRDFALGKGVSGISWRVADIQQLPFEDASFDTVISCETIEHVPEPGRAVRELARVLHPGGRLVLTTPNYFSTIGMWRLYLPLRGRRFSECGQPINQFTMIPRTLVWLRRAGLRVTTVDAIGHYLPFPGRPPIRFPRLDNPRLLMKWFAMHSLFVATKL
jgi:2-polyprenyl-3-methyl-5-hydroxy-6-metoxy-1,4-benzoquinol methylase